MTPVIRNKERVELTSISVALQHCNITAICQAMLSVSKKN